MSGKARREQIDPLIPFTDEELDATQQDSERRLGQDQVGGVAQQQVTDRDVSAPDSVIYTGIASHREITRAEFEQAGVADQETVAWTRQNRFTVPLSHLREDAVQVLRRESSFRINN